MAFQPLIYQQIKAHVRPKHNYPVVSIKPTSLLQKLVSLRNPSPRSTTRGPIIKKIPPIDSVYARGNVDIELIGTSDGYKAQVNKSYPDFRVRVWKRGVYISNNYKEQCKQNPKPRIKIYLHELRHLTIAGNSCVRGHGFDSYCGLTITHCGCGSVCFSDPIHLTNIESSGFGKIFLPNVVSDQVHIIASRGTYIKLRGTANLLTVRAFQQAYIDAHCMPTCQAMVQAMDAACIMVRACSSLWAFANGYSNIYYYGCPMRVVHHGLTSGNVLRIGW
jgi:Putative auto-transporter adhesin, head GIN domain